MRMLGMEPMLSDNESDEEITVDTRTPTPKSACRAVGLVKPQQDSRPTTLPKPRSDVFEVDNILSSTITDSLRHSPPTLNVPLLMTSPPSPIQSNSLTHTDELSYIISPVTPAIRTSSSPVPGASADSYDVADTPADTPPTTSVQTTSVSTGTSMSPLQFSANLGHTVNHTSVSIGTSMSPPPLSAYPRKKEKSSDNNKMHKCSMCPKEYSLRSSLKRHMVSHDIGAVSCKVCAKTFCHISSLKRHEETHSNLFVGQCHICFKEFKTKYGLSMHLKAHEGQYRLICDICGKGFNYASELKAHTNKHLDIRPYHCPNCPKTFSYATALARHKQTCSTGGTFPCERCSKVFRAERYLKAHIIAHDNPEQFPCEVCGRAFAHRATLYKHRKQGKCH